MARAQSPIGFVCTMKLDTCQDRSASNLRSPSIGISKSKGDARFPGLVRGGLVSMRLSSTKLLEVNVPVRRGRGALMARVTEPATSLPASRAVRNETRYVSRAPVTWPVNSYGPDAGNILPKLSNCLPFNETDKSSPGRFHGGATVPFTFTVNVRVWADSAMGHGCGTSMR